MIHRIGGTVTFNAAGVHPWTLSGHQVSLSDAPGLINSFRVKGDFLSSGQDGRHMFGHLLPPEATAIAPNGVGTNYWLNSSAFSPATKHSMNSIREGLDQLLPTKNSPLESSQTKTP